MSIGRSLLADPSVLLFDEPTSGIDFDMTKEIYRLLKEFHSSGKTIIFTSHRHEEIKSGHHTKQIKIRSYITKRLYVT